MLRTTGLALCYSAGEYACPVWSRSVHAGQVDVALNETCRIITGCLKPTPLQMLHPLAGIAPPDVRRSVASGIERAKLETDQRHPMHNYTPVPQRLKSRRGFYKTVAPVDGEASRARRDLWQSRSLLPSPFVPLLESLPPGHDLPRRAWQSLNRLRTRVGRSKDNRSRWGFAGGADLGCECGAAVQTMSHLIACPLCPETCSREDLMSASGRALAVAAYWADIV